MMNEPSFVLDWHHELDFYPASTWKQQSTKKHATLLRHIILSLCLPVFSLTPKFSMPSGEAANTNFNVFGLTWPEMEPTAFSNRGQHANHDTTKGSNQVIKNTENRSRTKQKWCLIHTLRKLFCSIEWTLSECLTKVWADKTLL